MFLAVLACVFCLSRECSSSESVTIVQYARMVECLDKSLAVAREVGNTHQEVQHFDRIWPSYYPFLRPLTRRFLIAGAIKRQTRQDIPGA